MKEPGNVLPWLLSLMASVPPEEHIHFSKMDLANGYWPMIVLPDGQWCFAYGTPLVAGEPILLVIPSALQMGWNGMRAEYISVQQQKQPKMLNKHRLIERSPSASIWWSNLLSQPKLLGINYQLTLHIKWWQWMLMISSWQWWRWTRTGFFNKWPQLPFTQPIVCFQLQPPWQHLRQRIQFLKRSWPKEMLALTFPRRFLGKYWWGDQTIQGITTRPSSRGTLERSQEHLKEEVYPIQ
jgi:hypothetical protein